jgi:hypothetical protein
MSDGKSNAAQVSNSAGIFDDLSLHFILGTNHPALANATPEFTAAAAYALPYAVGPYFDKVQAQVDEHPELKGKVHLAVTEWLFNGKGFGERNFTDESPSWMNEGGAVMAAGFPPLGLLQLLDSIRDQVFFSKVAYLAVQLDRVAGDRARVRDRNGLSIEVQIFVKSNLIALDRTVGDIGCPAVVFRRAGELFAIHFKSVGVMLLAYLRVKGRGPLSGQIGCPCSQGKSRSQYSQNRCVAKFVHCVLLFDC